MGIQSRVTINGLTGTLCTLPLASNYQSNVTEVNRVYSYLPGLVDPDGDSLAIELIPCVDEGYWLPPQTQIDPLTGELTISPELPGAYAFCMWIRKFRYFGPTGSQQLAVTGTTYLEIMIDVTNTVGLGEYGADNGFVVFPNPTTASFFMRGLPPSTTTIEVHDVLGRVVLRSTAPHNTHRCRFSTRCHLFRISVRSHRAAFGHFAFRETIAIYNLSKPAS
ncbi:MAG: T9SS type A sorting domain-containing protein [Flavobacteriales bacterium]|nr:T9SS type A sorting domain-containing protein [Flavobacteriales bacterium]